MKNVENEMVKSGTSQRVWIPTKKIGLVAQKMLRNCMIIAYEKNKPSKFRIMMNESFIAESKENTSLPSPARDIKTKDVLLIFGF